MEEKRKLNQSRADIARAVKDFRRIEDDQEKRLGTGNNGKLRIDHIATANLAIKVVNVVPGMHPVIKRILTMRIAEPVKTGKSLSHMQVAISLGMREHEVKRLEREGLMIMNDYLKRASAFEGRDIFNQHSRNVRDLKRQLAHPTKAAEERNHDGE